MSRLPENELQNRISIIKVQSTYTGPDQDIDIFLAQIEHNCVEVNVPPSQWVDVALHFMAGKIRVIMSKYKEYIQSTQNPTGTTLWEIFKHVFKELHVKAVEAMNNRPASSTESGDEDSFTNAAAGGVVVAGITYAVGPPAIVAALSAVGFTSTGVLGGSLAAAAQSAIYGGSTGGIFAVMQSIGATGVVASAPVLALGAGAAGLGYIGYRLIRRSQD